MKTVKGISNRVLLVILDGFGANPKDLKNAIIHGKTPHFDEAFKTYPFTTIDPGGIAVGLPKGVAGNSEVGHLNLGAGRPVRQDLVRINEAIDKGNFQDLPRFQELLKVTQEKSKRLHIMGLLSDGGVHSHINHLKHILKLLSNENVEVYAHFFMDGRDTPKDNGIKYLKEIQEMGLCTIASIQGRSIGMDRDRRWEKIEKAYNVMIGEGLQTPLSPADYIQSQYDKNIFDEFIEPVMFTLKGKIQADDSVFFINYRPDRARQITLAMKDPSFKEFNISVSPNYFLCMSSYVPDELPNLPVLFDKEKIKGTLAEYLASLNKKQFKIAETEKYAHVTYFFNGGEEKPFPGEERKLIPSPKEVKTYDEKPQMSAYEVLDELTLALRKKDFSFYLVNFANADMVGHTGNYQAALKAIETLDDCLGKLIKVCAEEDVALLITADHGNADQMVYDDGSVHTSHSKAVVPFCLIHPSLKNNDTITAYEGRALKDVAPTVLYLLGIDQPKDFTGESVFS